MRFNATTYEQYLKLIAGSSQPDLLTPETRLVIEHFSKRQNVPSRFAPVVYMLDYTTQQYLYVDDTCFNLLGFQASYFMEGGLEKYKRRWHRADFEVINSKVFPENLKFIRNIPSSEYADYIFSYNHRTLNAREEYITVLQRYTFFPGKKTGIPAGVIGVVFDITHFKNDLSIIHTIEKVIYENGERLNKLLYKNIYPVYETSPFRLLSNREKEVMKYMADGLSSKQIADKLCISINTVNNHRKNMLSKTACKTSSELLNFAGKYGLF